MVLLSKTKGSSEDSLVPWSSLAKPNGPRRTLWFRGSGFCGFHALCVSRAMGLLDEQCEVSWTLCHNVANTVLRSSEVTPRVPSAFAESHGADDECEHYAFSVTPAAIDVAVVRRKPTVMNPQWRAHFILA